MITHATPRNQTPTSAVLSDFSPTVTTGRGRVRFHDRPQLASTDATNRPPAPARGRSGPLKRSLIRLNGRLAPSRVHLGQRRAAAKDESTGTRHARPGSEYVAYAKERRRARRFVIRRKAVARVPHCERDYAGEHPAGPCPHPAAAPARLQAGVRGDVPPLTRRQPGRVPRRPGRGCRSRGRRPGRPLRLWTS